MLKALNPLSKLAVCCIWLVAAVLIFDARFQLAAILVPALALVAFNHTSPFALLALMVPFALFGFGFLTTSLLFRQESDFALRMAGESLLASPAFSAGLTLFLRALACGMVSLFFALTTDPGLFVRALMQHARLPPRIGYSLFAGMQLVPDLAGEAQQMRLARAMKSGRRVCESRARSGSCAGRQGRGLAPPSQSPCGRRGGWHRREAGSRGSPLRRGRECA